jgi:hypothetical protein
MQITLQVSHGSLTSDISGRNAKGQPPRTVSFTGTLGAINAALRSLIYTPDRNYFGQDTLHIQMVDPGSGLKESVTVTAAQDVAITVVANDVPVISLPGPQTTDVNQPLPLFLSTGPAGKGGRSSGVPEIAIADGDIGTGAGKNAHAGQLDVTLQVAHGTLRVNRTAGVTVAQNAGATVEFKGGLSAVNAAFGSLMYTPESGYVGPDNLHIQVIDPGSPGSPPDTVTATADLSISVVVNDVPVITVPAAQTTSRNKPLSLSPAGAAAIMIADGDIGRGVMQLSLQVEHGTLKSTVKGTKQGAALLFSGTLAEIHRLLNSLIYIPAANYVGPDTLHIQVVDPGNPASPAGTVTATQDLAISVLANDVPVIRAPRQQQTSPNRPLAFSGGKGAAPAISITDADIGSGKTAGTLDVTLQVDHATLSIAGSGVVFKQQQHGLLEFTGTLAAINRALTTLVYRPDRGYVGPDVLQLQIVDPGNVPDPLNTVVIFGTVRITVLS